MKKFLKTTLLVVTMVIVIGCSSFLAGCSADEIAELKSQIETIKSQNETLTSQNTELTEERDTYKTQSENKSTQIETLQSQNETLTEENETLTEENEQLEAERDQYKAESEAKDSQLAGLATMNTIVNATYKSLFYYAGQLVNAGDPDSYFTLATNMTKRLYVALNEQEITLGEVYNIIIQDGEDTTEIPVKLDYQPDNQVGKYLLYFLNTSGENPRASRITFKYTNGQITYFDVCANGKISFSTYSIVGYDCQGAPAISFSNEYDAAAMLTELQAEIPANHQITITQAAINALYA